MQWALSGLSTNQLLAKGKQTLLVGAQPLYGLLCAYSPSCIGIGFNIYVCTVQGQLNIGTFRSFCYEIFKCQLRTVFNSCIIPRRQLCLISLVWKHCLHICMIKVGGFLSRSKWKDSFICRTPTWLSSGRRSSLGSSPTATSPTFFATARIYLK